MSYQIKCNFKEKLIEIDIARYLGCFAPHLGGFYYLENANEQLTGADLISEDTNAMPIYIQAKVSQGLKTINKVAASRRKNRSKLEDIREFRHDLGLDKNDDHFLYFQLRRKAEHAHDYQHNILMNYANTGFSHAFYVAPLCLDKHEYQKDFLNINNIPYEPFFLGNYALRDFNWTSYYGFLPFLRNHISIIPHELIDTHEHFYAYSNQGIDVTWHSPEYIDDSPSRLSDTMIRIMKDFYDSENEQTISSIASRLREMPIMQNIKQTNERSIDLIVQHGQILEHEYGIKQLLLTKKKR